MAKGTTHRRLSSVATRLTKSEAASFPIISDRIRSKSKDGVGRWRPLKLSKEHWSLYVLLFVIPSPPGELAETTCLWRVKEGMTLRNRHALPGPEGRPPNVSPARKTVCGNSKIDLESDLGPEGRPLNFSPARKGWDSIPDIL
jgi:hypothetical protein